MSYRKQISVFFFLIIVAIGKGQTTPHAIKNGVLICNDSNGTVYSTREFKEIMNERTPQLSEVLSGSGGIHIYGDCSDQISKMLLNYKNSDGSGSDEIRLANQYCSHVAGWIEFDPGACSAGGPPPICKINHWYKDPNRSMSIWKNEQSKIYTQRLKNAKNLLKSCNENTKIKDENVLESITSSGTANSRINNSGNTNESGEILSPINSNPSSNSSVDKAKKGNCANGISWTDGKVTWTYSIQEQRRISCVYKPFQNQQEEEYILYYYEATSRIINNTGKRISIRGFVNAEGAEPFSRRRMSCSGNDCHSAIPDCGTIFNIAWGGMYNGSNIPLILEAGKSYEQTGHFWTEIQYICPAWHIEYDFLFADGLVNFNVTNQKTDVNINLNSVSIPIKTEQSNPDNNSFWRDVPSSNPITKLPNTNITEAANAQLQSIENMKQQQQTLDNSFWNENKTVSVDIVQNNRQYSSPLKAPPSEETKAYINNNSATLNELNQNLYNAQGNTLLQVANLTQQLAISASTQFEANYYSVVTGIAQLGSIVESSVEKKREEKRIAEEKRRIEEARLAAIEMTLAKRKTVLDSVDKLNMLPLSFKNKPQAIYGYFVAWDSITYDNLNVAISNIIMMEPLSDGTWPLLEKFKKRYAIQINYKYYKLIGFYKDEQTLVDAQVSILKQLKEQGITLTDLNLKHLSNTNRETPASNNNKGLDFWTK